MSEHHDTVIVGGGQAGLAMSSVLHERGREHVVLERGRVAERWRTERWDSLRFQFPNWSLQLPGYTYAGDDPDGFAHFSEIIALIEGYARASRAPVREGSEVVSLASGDGGGFVVTSRDGDIHSRRVVIATGPFQRPLIPQVAQGLPAWVHQTDPTRYRSSAQLPAGAVLVVGSGASGIQIADELNAAGRTVFLSVSRHRRVPRRFRGKDVYWWLDKLGRFDQTIDSFPSREWPPSTVVTGVNGGYDVDVRRLAADGVRVVGRTVGATADSVTFDASATTVLAEADEAYVGFVAAARALAAGGVGEELTDEDDDPPPPPVGPDIGSVESLDLRAENVATVVWSTGYRYAYDWVRVPVFDERGRPLQQRGVTAWPGLYFLGLHWMHTFKSGILVGVGADAEYLADHMATSG